MSGQKYFIDVLPRLPDRLGRIGELADNLWFSWHWPTRQLFAMLDRQLWWRVGRNPKLFLRYIDQSVLNTAASDQTFLATYHGVLAEFDAYHNPSPDNGSDYRPFPFDPSDLIAYFCAEFGFHDSMPIYSGGLGILAGDHCKTASDLRLPFVAVGLLYHQGYFHQRIDAHGNQLVEYTTAATHEIPVSPASDAAGNELIVHCPLAERQIAVKIWRTRVGRVSVILLDTDVPQNDLADRAITRVLYGGDSTMRIQQEIIMGIGGVRALRALGLNPTIWHLNEGHAAFATLERARELVSCNVPFAAALEAVAAAAVFTTHTPVSAGHDVFDDTLVLEQLHQPIRELGISNDEFLRLGRQQDGDTRFNMTWLAATGARRLNGVSRIHGTISSNILASLWPDVPAEENPVGYVTNGVHVPTFMRKDWVDLLAQHLGPPWSYRLMDAKLADSIMDIPDERFWSVKQQVKSQMIDALRRRLTLQHRHNQHSDAHIQRMLRLLDPAAPDVLIIGFARRFASYKRATLLFSNQDWLREIVRDEQRPVVFVFAGKAHPADEPGQRLMQEVHRIAHLPEFFGHILLVEGYSMELGGLLTSGVDVWLNTPVHPLEASGTSGMKAAINGTLNLSVLDGWWAESYDGSNGWAIPPVPATVDEAERDSQDASTLYEILQDEVVPLYYDHDRKLGYAPAWVRMCKRSMASVLPYFNSQRLLRDYVHHFYLPAATQGRALAEGDHAGARTLAAWKSRVREAWPGIHLRPLSAPPPELPHDGTLTLDVAVRLNGLQPDELCVECLISRGLGSELTVPVRGHAQSGRPDQGLVYLGDEPRFIAVCTPLDALNDDEHRYRLAVQPPWCGGLSFEIRARPSHPLLSHPHEPGLLRWIEA